MEAFPAFFPLAGRRVVIAGEGEAAEAKARLFEGSPALIVRLAGDEALSPEAYAGAALAFVAGADRSFRLAAAAAARAAHVPVNVVDDAELCDFHTPAVIDRGQVVAAVGTGGAAPILAALLRADVEASVPPGAGRVAALLKQHQDAVRAAFPDLPARRAFLRGVLDGPAAQAAQDGDMARASALLAQAIAGAGAAPAGRVSVIVGEASGDLISLRTIRALGRADVVVCGEEGEALVRAHARRDVERAPDATPQAIAALARDGRQVAVVIPATETGLIGDLAGLGIDAEALYPAPA